ncbi:MAG: 4-hydroxy-tetrahydrodipicolinate synthase [Saprospiraceae bacterium]|nr:MAG: dihydrodipicolinate synthase [Bacteroidetes bacterium OLB9]MCO6463350.1 4-hydroxy-tetrahydrodipicolinate synthase [Saprospiraceae bacterium]
MKDQRFIGTGVAIITPFKNGAIDFPGLEQVINHVINGGVNYIVALGSTGEAATLSDDEQRSILDFCIEKVDNRVPIVAGNFGMNNTHALTQKIKNYNFEGISAILAASPAYVKPTQEGIFRHFAAVAEVCPVPVILYNVPGRTSSNMDWETTVRLARHSDKFIGIKEASGNLQQVTKIIKNKPEHFLVISGDDEVILPICALGGDGVISVIANVLPKAFSQTINFALDQDYYAARKLNEKTYDLHKWLYIEGNPVGIKAAVASIGLCTKEVRLPLAEMTDGNYVRLKDELDQILNQLR